ncbi:hypothetical protein GCM10028778_00190 [Barrientosiimonas marina]|uniref:DUF2512 family protein n=1 Tax=Lentibacillus kimchii TaxID=1542911 RepID=A0ABW2UV23_9BACI
MTLEGSNAAISILIVAILTAWAVSYLYGWKMIELSGFVGSQIAMAGMINLFLWACAVFGWFLYAFDIGKALFFGGLVLLSVLFAVSEAALITLLMVRRKTWLAVYHKRNDNNRAYQ